MPEHINGNKNSNGKMHPPERSLRSREMSEVISVKPGFIVNWGMFIMLFIVVAAILLTAFIKVPDTISTNITIAATTEESSGTYHGWATIPAGTARNIQEGQKVFVTVNDKKEDGVTEGIIESITAPTGNNDYRVNISFKSKGYVTGSTSAKAAINTGQQSLLNKLFTNLVPSFKNKQED